MADLGINVIFEGRNLVRILEGLGVTVGISALSVVCRWCSACSSASACVRAGEPCAGSCSSTLSSCASCPSSSSYSSPTLGSRASRGSTWTASPPPSSYSPCGAAPKWVTSYEARSSRSRATSTSPPTLWDSPPKQTMRRVILPQTLRRLAPPAVNLITRMIKTTSLVVLIGVVEVLKVGQQIIDANRFNYPTASLWIYGLIFALYFLICWPISLLSRHMEKTWQN